jgi:hypothetical protein
MGWYLLAHSSFQISQYNFNNHRLVAVLEEKEPSSKDFQIKLGKFWDFFIIKPHANFYAR